MKPEYAVKIIDNGIKDDTGFRPFSNGSEAAEWVCENCGACKKAMMCYDPEGYDNFRDGGRSETLNGLNCFGEYAMGVGWITGKIPEEISIWMGGTEIELPGQCRFFTDNDNDRPDRQQPPCGLNQPPKPFRLLYIFWSAVARWVDCDG